jgi:PAS domain S-box-containing protein
LTNAGIDGESLHIAGTWLADVFRRSTLGIIQTDVLGRLLYANPRAHEISGYPDLTAVSLRDLFPDDDNYQIIRHQLGVRRQGLEDEYEIAITSPDGRQIPIRISSMPVVSGSRVLGALSIVRSLELERISSVIHAEISSATSSIHLLERVSHCIRDVIPFDLFRANLYSTDAHHVRTLFEYPLFGDRPETRWTVVTDAVKQVVQNPEPSRHHLPDFKGQSGADFLLSKGFQWSMRFPIHRQGHVAGSITVVRRGPKFSDREFEIFRGLPLDSTLAAVLFFESRADLRFTFRLAKSINRCSNEDQIFNLLARALVSHYGWSHVSVFVPDTIKGEMILRSEAVRRAESRLPLGYKQPISTGLLGYAFKAQKDVCVPDVQHDPDFANIVVHAPRSWQMQSELCMCINAQGRAYALLNLEDARRNAFSDEERKSLRDLLDDLGDIIQRRTRDSLVNATFASTPTAVFLVDQDAIIREVNPAASAIVDMPAHSLIGASITDFIPRTDIRDIIADVPRPIGDIDLISKEQRRIHGTLAGVPLEGTHGLRMLTFRDTSIQKKIVELDALTQVYAELARQVKPELAIMGACLRDLRDLAMQPLSERFKSAVGLRTRLDTVLPNAIADLLKNIDQLESTFDGVLLSELSNELPRPTLMTIYVPRFVLDVVSKLPIADSKAVTLSITSEGYIRADPAQLALVITASMGYLLRYRLPAAPISMLISDSGPHVRFVLSCAHLRKPRDIYSKPDDLELARTINDIALGTSYLQRIIESHHGSLTVALPANEFLRIEFELPATGGDPL